MPKLTWKVVFLIWLVALPFMGGTGFLMYQKYPAPFHTAAEYGKMGLAFGQKTWNDYQKKEAAKKAQEKAAAEKAKKEAAAAQQAGGGWE